MIAMRVKTSGRSVYGLTGSEAWHDHAAHGTLRCVDFGFRRGVG